MAERFQLIVIGAGPGGYPLALRAAKQGWKVALVERDEVGGTCLNWGCIPTKALLASAKGFAFLQNAAHLGLSAGEIGFDWAKIQARKNKVVDQLRSGIRKLLEKAGVTLVKGDARLHPGLRVTVSGASPWEADGERICLAVGSRPWIPPGIPTDPTWFWTSDQALGATAIPEKLLVVGGGVIGLELGQVFARFGAKVTIVEMQPQILPGLDSAVARRLLPVFTKSGLEIILGQKVENLQEKGGEVVCRIGDQERAFSRTLLAIGRRPNLSCLDGTGLQIALEKQFLAVDEGLQTSVPGVFAIGDCIPGPMLAHKASHDAAVLAGRFAGHDVRASYAAVPSCVYTMPEIAWVGLSEDEAKARNIEVKVGRFPFSASGKALCAGESEGQVKVLLDGRNTVVGSVLWGPEVSNLIQEPTIGVALGLDGHRLAEVIHPHPTLVETVMEGLENALGLSVHS